MLGLNVGSLFVQSYSGEDAEGLIVAVGGAVSAGTVMIAGKGAEVTGMTTTVTGASVGTRATGATGDPDVVGFVGDTDA